MKHTHKWSAHNKKATELAAGGLSDAAIAEALGVDRATVWRWRRDGKLQSLPEKPAMPVGTTPADWAAAQRKDRVLDATAEQLVAIGEQALLIAFAVDERSSARMAAAGRFQDVVKQLEARAVLAAREPERPAQAASPVAPRRVTDPRGILTAVNG